MRESSVIEPETRPSTSSEPMAVKKYPSLQIDITSKCNFRCYHCPRTLMEKTGNMDYEMYRRIIDQFPRGKLSYVTLGGWGEALLHPRVEDFVGYAATKGAKVQITSNASLLSDEKIRRILDGELSTLCFSIDACDKDTLASLRPNSENYDVFGNIERFVRENKRRNKRIAIGLLFLLNGYNIGGLDNFIEWGTALEANFILISAVRLKYPGLDDTPPDISAEDEERLRQRLSPDTAIKTTRNLTRFVNRFCPSFIKDVLRKPFEMFRSSRTQVLFKLRRPFGGPCPNLEDSLFVSWDGEIYPCCSFAIYKETMLASDPYNLIRVWNGEALSRFREKHTGHKLCRLCPELLSSPSHTVKS